MPEPFSRCICRSSSKLRWSAARSAAEMMKDKLQEAKITRDWIVFFRARYREAERLARSSLKAEGRGE